MNKKAYLWLIEVKEAWEEKRKEDKIGKVCMFVCIKCGANPGGNSRLGGLIRLKLT